jgi:small-conductance mechanosensitive channel
MLERFDPRNWTISWTEAAQSALAVAVAVVIAYALYRLAYALVLRLVSRSNSPADDLVVTRIRQPIKWSVIAIAVTLVAQADPLIASVWEPFARFLRPALLGWIAYSLVKAFAAALELRLEAAVDPVAARSRRTRIAILSRTATFAIVFITVGLMLLGIPGVRDIGTTLLASAGLAALAVGAAAQPALKSLIAGLQMALTEPLRIGDLVVVDGHTGRVEEIRMSFVTVRTWDERVVIVPTIRFLDESFENWSRKSEMLLDPITEVEPIRAEFLRFLDTHPLWDRRTGALLMTEAYPESVELRLGMSAATIGDLWELRCAVREHMLAWLRQHMPDALIRHRLEVEAANEKVAKG